ncbi:Ig-like domain-containing protein [Paenibacillus mucilaginosus]|uniref:Cellulose-binding family II protein n=1 Tax=Paenibacillus mucilaginosus (strain KNP414) TaxID=1036673 RepID=F8FHQ6_PAEMK|nr:Ig-like domain-containing protein [Paenibacillus mucilaginosus]AEI42763.1 cellulose-binding family II protein [Paenibacillus mucilaginosus KNP414]MCG7216857.1 Ig-like domain-containing protein [Paenibacillus mucilaginosus]WDM30955.1 Ig-like domain-containing protein [Paenibacillus mucilaginosus]
MKKKNKWLAVLTAAALTASTGSSLTTIPGKAFAAESIGSEAVQSDIVPVKTQAYDWGRVKIVGGGLITGIIYSPTEKDLIYARTDMGGAYRWDTATKTWIQLLEWLNKEDWNLSGVESLASDPVDPNRVYIAAGTYSNDWVQSNGYILRSKDRGQTWEKTEMPCKFGGNMPGRTMGERLAVDPNDNRILYLGARNGNGLWKSEDYGATWHKVSSFTAVGDVEDGYGGKVGPVWITFDPSTGSAGHATQTIYVGLADRQTSIYKSVDGGATWEPVAGQPKQGFLPHHATLGSNGMLYVTYNSEIGPFTAGSGSVWKLDTKTGEWSDISPGGAGDTSNPYGGLAVDAQHPDTLMVTTLNKWWPDNQIYRSTDGGQTWKPFWEFTSYPKRDNRYTIDYSISPWLDWGIQRDPETDPVTSPTLGWGIGDLEIDPFNSDRIMYGTGATLYGSEDMTDFDKGEKIGISVMANGIEENAILTLISPSSGAPLISGMGDIGGFRHADLNTSPHMIRNPYLNSTLDMDYAETNPNLIVRVGHTQSDIVERMGVSTDNGVTWTPATNPWQAGVPINYNTGGGYVAVGANGHTIVWAPNLDGNGEFPVSFTTDLGKTWTASKGIPHGAMVSSDRVNPGKFYGFLDGTFYVSTDGGANFSATAASGLPKNLNGKFKAAPAAEGDIWLASSEGLFRSTDSGASFKKVNGISEAMSVGFGKEAPGKTHKTIYAGLKVNGGKYGFYRSEDEGASWIRMNDDQHQFANAVETITGDGQVYGRVYIGTNGMGIVRGDIKQDAAVRGFHVNDLTVEAGKSAALAPVFDGGASSRPVVWSSSDESVASVSGDQVTGLKPGTAAIAAVSADGQYAATAVVTVTPVITQSNGKIHAEPTVNAVGTASVSLGGDIVRNAIEQTPDKKVTAEVKALADVKAVIVEMPAQSLSYADDRGVKTIAIDNGLAVVSIDPKLVRGTRPSPTASVAVQVGIVDASTLPGDVRNKLGDSRVLDFSLTVAGKPVTKFDGNDVRVAIGYTLKDGEKPNRVTLYYLNDNGKLEIIKNAKYNPKTGHVEFKAKQLGKYAVKYN